MHCQYGQSCSNVGVYSCSECGLLVCGKHARLSLNRVECNTCYHTRQVELARQHNATLEAKQAQEAKYSKGCVTSLAGLGAIIIGLILAFSTRGNAVGGVFALLLLIPGALVGIIGGFSVVYYTFNDD